MAISLTQFTHDPAYGPFLGAAVGEDGTGADVSVLSMLARLDVDPWTEATDLSHMQERPARQRLEDLLTLFTDVPTLVSDQGRVASMLLALLPRRANGVRLPQVAASHAKTLLPTEAPLYWIIWTILILGWITALAQGQ